MPVTSDREALRAGLIERVLLELGQHLADADRNAARYVRDYVDCVLTNRGRPPYRGIRPEIAKLIRELVLDGDVQWRRSG